MKENNLMIENRLKRAVESSVPDVLANVFEQIETREVKKIEETSETIKVVQRKKVRFQTWAKAAASVAAVLVVVFGLWLNWNYSTKAVVAFDVNPSIELSVNRSDRILKARPLNSEAEAVIGGMKLKGVDLDVAVNALIGSLVQKAYISDLNNSILITVNSKDVEKSQELQERLSNEVGSLLRSFSVDGSVLSQTSVRDELLDELAKQYGISPGKAALIQQLVAADPTISYEDLVRLSINDLNILIEARQPQLAKVSISGHASEKAYIGVRQAENIAFTHAGVSEAQVRELEIDYDYEDGRLIYEIEFYVKGSEYEYEIDARNGNVLKFEQDHKEVVTKPTDKPGNTADKAQPNTDKSLIGHARAEEIAFQHAGVSRSQVRKLETELEFEKGVSYYEVEFKVGTTEYEYEIDAYSGKILDYEIEYDD